MSSDYTIVDITDGVIPGGRPRSEYNEALSVVLGESPRPEALSAHDDLVRSLRLWADRHDLPFSAGDLIIDTDEDDDLRLILPYITVDRDGDIVRKTREWSVTAQYTVEVVVTIEAASEAEARDEADGELSSAVFDIEWVDGAEVSDTDYLGIRDVDEV